MECGLRNEEVVWRDDTKGTGAGTGVPVPARDITYSCLPCWRKDVGHSTLAGFVQPQFLKADKNLPVRLPVVLPGY